MPKVLKILVGNVYIDGKSYPVYQDAWEQKDKEGKPYYKINMPIFVQNVEPKQDKPKTITSFEA